MSVQPAQPVRGRVIGFAIVTALVVSLAPTMAAEETQAQLILADDTTMSGIYDAEGAGEVQILATPQFDVQGAADRIVVEAYTLRSQIVKGPTGDVEYGDDVPTRKDHDFKSATLSLVAANQGFKSLLIAHEEGNGLTLAPSPAQDVPLLAYKDPGLLLDERGASAQHSKDPNSNFTYVADGDRFPLPTVGARAEGAPMLYFWQAEFKVDGKDRSQHFVAGETREEVLPGYHQVERTYFKVRFDQGHVETTGNHLAWIDEPLIHLNGILTSEKAQGTVVHQGDDHRLEDVPLTASGRLVLSPGATGEPVPIEDAVTHVGTSMPTSGIYRASSVAMSGSDVMLEFGGMAVAGGSSDLVPMATTVGVLAIVGAAWALTPQGQWLIMGAVAPLYAKTQRDRLLESPQRERLMQAIQANPGIHLSGLREIAELSWGTTVYHLRLMEKRELVVSVARAGQRHFFVKTPRADAQRLHKAVATIVGQQTAHRVAFTVLSMPGSCQKELAEQLGVSRRVIAHHIARLERSGLITKLREGGRVRCYPTSILSDALAILDTGENSVVTPASQIPGDNRLEAVPAVKG